jgi:hypothetical protein
LTQKGQSKVAGHGVFVSVWFGVGGVYFMTPPPNGSGCQGARWAGDPQER